MPTQLWPNFIGQAYRDRSLNADAETCINLYPSTLLSGKNPKKQFLIGTPGIDGYNLDDTARPYSRGTFNFTGLVTTGEERCFTVIEDQFQEIHSDGTKTTWGTIHDDGNPVSMASNGQGGLQVLVVGGGEVRVFNATTNTLSDPIAGPWVNRPIMCTFHDGFFHLLEMGTLKIWYSAAEDGTMWPGLNFYARSTASDNAIALCAAGGRIWVFGSETSEAFYNSGDATTPYVPIQGSLFQIGIEGPWPWAITGDTIVWMGRSSRGARTMYQLNGYGGARISTPAVEYALNQYSHTDRAEALAYEEEGHSFVAWTIPGAATWVVDLQEPGQPWHQRGTLSPATGQWTQWRVRGHAYVFGKHLVGDWLTGNIGVLNMDTYTEYGSTLVAERAAPYLSDDNQWVFLDQIELGAETGVGNAAVPAPEVELALSYDSGHTYTNAAFAFLGAAGDFLARPLWYMLGRARPDRLVARIRISDPVKRALGPGLWITMQSGTGQR